MRMLNPCCYSPFVVPFYVYPLQHDRSCSSLLYWYRLIFYILVDYHGPCLLYYICKSLIISNKKRYVNTFYDFLGGVLSWSQQNGLQGVC